MYILISGVNKNSKISKSPPSGLIHFSNFHPNGNFKNDVNHMHSGGGSFEKMKFILFNYLKTLVLNNWKVKAISLIVTLIFVYFANKA